MRLLRNFRNLNIQTFRKLQNSTGYLGDNGSLRSSDSSRFSFISAISRKSFSISHVFSVEIHTESESTPKSRKPLSVCFKEAVGLSEKTDSDSEIDGENDELKKKLRKLDEEVKDLSSKTGGESAISKRKTRKNDDSSKVRKEKSPRGLSSLFSGKEVNNGEGDGNVKNKTLVNPDVCKELSVDMQAFVYHLYNEGYFQDANFLRRNRFDINRFDTPFARTFIVNAAEKFGQDHQEIAKWVSAGDLKKVALFGCPSVGRRAVFSAKTLRRFFGIEEEKVCDKCTLRFSCQYANQKVWRGDTMKLNMNIVMKVITPYAMELVPEQLAVPEEIKNAVNRLLKEIVELGKTVSPS